MKLTELSIKKPIALTMVVILCILLGVMGYINLGADLFPAVNSPVLSITSVYPGAGAEEIEKDVIKPIEDAVSSISGLDKIHSNAIEGLAQITLQFKLSADTNTAFMDTQKALEGAIDKLPKDATRPVVYKYDMGASPILVLALSGEKPFEEIQNEAESIKERLERVSGVGNVTIFGGMEKELIIKADKVKLDYYGLSIAQIVRSIQSDNLNFPGGIIRQPNQDKIITVEGEFTDINQVKDFRIPVKQGFVRLSDIADVALEFPDIKEITRLKGKTAIGITIQKQSDANIVETGKRTKSELEKIKATLKGTDLKIVDDSTTFITSSLNETRRNLVEGIITTAIVLFIFLRQWNSVFIVMVAIPTSLVSTFFMMYFSNFTFNMLSLMGLALCVGILVDDSVVVLENIHRHLKKGKDPITAAIDGRREIGMAAIAITLSDVVVFAPIAFLSGMVGQYFRQFGLVVVFATLFSLFVSFTVTPTMASRMFKSDNDSKNKKGKSEGKLALFVNNLEESLKVKYEKILIWALKHRITVVAAILLLLAVSVSFIVVGRIGAEFMPYMETGAFTVKVTTNPGDAIKNTSDKVSMIEEHIKTLPEVDYYYTRIGINNSANKAYIMAKLKDRKNRTKSQQDMIDEVRQWVVQNAYGANVTVENPSKSGDSGETAKPINVNIRGPKTEVLRDISKQVLDIVKETEGAIDVENSFQAGKPGLKIKIDKVAAANYGVSAFDISNTIRSSVEGTKAGVYRNNGEEYDVKIKLDSSMIKNANDINTLTVQSSTGSLVPVAQVTEISTSDSPASIARLNKQRLAIVSANVRLGYAFSELSKEIQNKIDKLDVPEGYSIAFGGDQEDMTETFTSLIQVMIFSIFLVYMVLVVLYESFLTPFVRILALPVGFIGALTMLAITGKTLNMFSMIGIIMLDGLAAKNGTILIDYTNTLMTKGYNLRDALIEAGKTRLKPILMTSFSLMVGMLPTALALGDGSELKSSMALVIIGGMLSSTILSPILLPVAYTLIDDFQKFVKNKFARKNKEKAIQNSI